MNDVRELCRKHTSLCEESIDAIIEVAGTLKYIADLTRGDVFIDCMGNNGSAVVVAQAKPSTVLSTYSGSVAGCIAQRENEPAVYRVLSDGLPVHDLKAVTQEHKTVKQDVTAITDRSGAVIGALICETDVSGEMQREKKLEAFMSSIQTAQVSPASQGESAMVREAHHRIKNNLQLVASLCNMRLRKLDDPTASAVIKDNINMILTVSAIHDILTHEGMEQSVSVSALLKKLCAHTQSLLLTGSDITLCVCGDDIRVPQEKATAVALVTNELLTNAIRHGCMPQGSGNIRIVLQQGVRYSSVVVEDDGAGFESDSAESGAVKPDKVKHGNGLGIADMIVRDKLGGWLESGRDSGVTKVKFSFII